MCPMCGAELKRDESGTVSCPLCGRHCSIEDVT